MSYKLVLKKNSFSQPNWKKNSENSHEGNGAAYIILRNCNVQMYHMLFSSLLKPEANLKRLNFIIYFLFTVLGLP